MSEQLVVHVDSQILSDENFCPEKWKLTHHDNWRPLSKALALERGTIMHHMLAHYYRERMRPGRQHPQFINGIVDECIMKGRVEASQSTHVTAEEFQTDIRVFKEYVIRWQNDGWVILAVEQPFTKTLYESPALRIEYDGIFDLKIIDPKLGDCIVDHKTESRKSDPFILSNQFQGYEWAFELPVIVNKIGYQKKEKKAKLDKNGNAIDSRFRRLYNRSGDEAIREWREDSIRQIVESIGWMKDLQAGKRMRKNRTSCDKYGGCIFQKVCKEPADVREHKLTVYYKKDRPWDPYERDRDLEQVAS